MFSSCLLVGEPERVSCYSTGIGGDTSCDTENHSLPLAPGFLSTPVEPPAGPSRASMSLDKTTYSGNHHSNQSLLST